MDFAEGFKVTDTEQLDAHGIDREALIKRICQAFAIQVYCDGFFNCDPHPGNLLVQVSPDGSVRPVLLDYGMCRELQSDKRIAFAKMIYSATSMDFGSLLTSFEEMGLKLKRHDPAEDMKNIRFVLRDTAPGKEMRTQFKKFREDVWQKRQQLPKSERNPVEAYPAELLFFFRVTLLLRGLCAVLGVRVRYSTLLAPYAKLALIRHHPIDNQAIKAVVPKPFPAAAAGLEHVQKAVLVKLKQLHRQGLFTGVQVAVYSQGRLIVNVAAGTRGDSDPRPMKPDSIVNCFSVTKGIAAACVHLLKQRNLIDYDDRVAQYWPEFGCHGKEDITIRQVLSHCAGLHRVPGPDTKLADLCDWDKMIEAMANSTPGTTPGKVTRYHILSFGWLVGGLVQAVTKKHLRDFVRSNISEPLDIEHEMFFGLGDGALEKVQSRLATLCNGFFVSPDGDTPSEDEVRKLMQQLKEVDKKQQAMETEQEETAKSDFRGSNGSTSSQPLLPINDSPVGLTEWPPAVTSRQHRYSDQLAELKKEVMHEAFAGIEHGWKFETNKRGIVIDKKAVPNSNNIMVRGTGVIPFPPVAVYEVLANLDKKSEWNSQFSCLEEIEELDVCTRIIRDEYKPIFPTSGRDFCLLQSVSFEEDGGFVVSTRSIEDDRCPPKSGLVRGGITVGGAVCQPLKEDPMKCRFVYMMAIDPKGTIPTFVANVVAVSQPLAVADIRDLLMKRNSPERYKALMTNGKRVRNSTDVHSDEGQLEEITNIEQHLDEDDSNQNDFDLSRLLTADPCIYNAKVVREACIPSANGHFSARAIAKFYSALLGTVDGVALFHPTTLKGAAELQAEEKMGMREEPMRWGLGYQKYTRMTAQGEKLDAPFGHMGLGGATGFCDPSCGLAVGITVNRLTLDRECTDQIVQTIYSALDCGKLAFA
eukprot:TRINITY_DN11255_c0_g1_i2.p1 TRINITY_DN11255_c0_g1~~TRINITY_DN11255_c0_g1_i2.p1  ORF type:complete len:1009 (+),score=297.20 TRINITY_DN11255_c0_g1_i2:259-3027(+)